MQALQNASAEAADRRAVLGAIKAWRRRWSERDWRQLPVSVARRLLRPFPDSVYLRLGYRAFFGVWPDYRNPRSFNEHIHVYMLRCRNPMLRVCADKALSREYIARQIGAHLLVPLLGVWDNADDVPLATLPRPFVLKPTAASGLVHFVRQHDRIDEDELRAIMRHWIRRDYSHLHREWCYQGLPRRLMAEAMLHSDDGALPADYKAYVIGGKVRFLQVDRGRFGHHTRNVYDASWCPLPARWSLEKHADDPRPACLDQMIETAEVLARPFTEFLRIDFYIIDGHLYVGELTNYPGAGFERFIPAEYSLEIGAFWPRAVQGVTANEKGGSRA